ncbi:MAG: hypothetical protein EZS28_049985 [Streblomastix strix]|uniref:Uncharacterized protein n=1 Tax=Streblomastix strix TaxID=222440 RepID=A0A5J4T8D4_9EUKA|nr:MAG: hypothetical protein EZS28_049985 [Streblomastix strix]
MEMVNNEPYNPINSSKTQAAETQVEQIDRNCQDKIRVKIKDLESVFEKLNFVMTVQEHLERQMQDGQKITRRFDMMVGQSQGEFAIELQDDSTKRNIDHGCIGNELRSCLGTNNNGGRANLQDREMRQIMDTQILKSARNDSNSDGVKGSERFHLYLQQHPGENRQYSFGVPFKEMESEVRSASNCKKNQEACFGEQPETGNAANGDYYVKKKVLDQAFAILRLPVLLDVFASRTNKRLKSYCYLLLDHQAYTINGYNFSWSQINPYLHPPISQILKVLSKVKQGNAKAVLVIPS